MKNKKVILSSILSLVLCLSLIVGGTFALFTSESKTNIAITSGKVEVVATIENLAVYSPTAIAEDGKIVDDTNAAANGVFANGGTAEIVDSTLTLDKIVPGDGVTFNISVTNNSNVDIKYRTVISAPDGDTQLMEALAVTINSKNYTGLVKGAWTSLEANGKIDAIPVSIELPTTAGDEYQGKTVNISVTVEAVQGNVVENIDVYDPDNTDEVTLDNVIDSAAEFVAFANAVNAGNDYAGETVTLATNIDLNGAAWTAINNFAGTFDGQGYTISNLKDASLFATLNGTVKNLELSETTRTFSAYTNSGTSAFVGTVANGAVVDNCTVSDVTLTWDDTVADCGDGISGVIGSVDAGATVKNCEFSDVTITAQGKLKRAGGIFGTIAGTVSNCDVDGVSIIATGKGYTQEAGGFVRQVSATANISDCIVNNVTITAEYGAYKTGGFAGITYGGTITNCDMNNVTMSVGDEHSEFGGFIGQHDSRSNTNRLTVADCEVTGLNMTINCGYAAWSCGSAGFISGVSGGADITNCSVEGMINATEATVAVGGFVGSGGSSTDSIVNITGCVANVDITVGDNVGGAFIGRAGRCMGANDDKIYFNFNNCEADGTVTVSGNGTAGAFYGEIFGTQNTFTGCKVDGADFAG